MVKGNTSDTYEMWQWGLLGMDILILGSKQTLNIVECLLHTMPSCGLIK
jgi:hypothetical protein